VGSRRVESRCSLVATPNLETKTLRNMGPVACCLKIGGMCVLYVFDVSILFTPGSVAESPLVRLARLEGAPCTVLYLQRITIRPSIKCIYPHFPLNAEGLRATQPGYHLRTRQSATQRIRMHPCSHLRMCTHGIHPKNDTGIVLESLPTNCMITSVTSTDQIAPLFCSDTNIRSW
jgi:hypothetical protein